MNKGHYNELACTIGGVKRKCLNLATETRRKATTTPQIVVYRADLSNIKRSLMVGFNDRCITSNTKEVITVCHSTQM
jgi:hypothetical protein